MLLLKKIFRIILKSFAIIAVLLVLAFGYFLWNIRIPTPIVNSQITPASYHRKQVGPDSYMVNNCWLKKNQYGIWEMYLEGSPFERGVIYGVLAKELIEKQEEVFVNQINVLIPNKFYQMFLKGFVAWFNKDIYKYIPDENLQEIYGISLSFSDKYDYVGPKFYRILYYHGAHDIGHALNDYNLVGCTSFAVNKEFSADSSLLIARNFDFYMGDDFAKEKLLVFVKPSTGYKYTTYSWAGFTGVVSGMNEKGITITINAAKSDIPFSAKEPISILAREILQYAQNTTEAIAIAQKRETFVSESILIGSAADDKAIIIEKSPAKMDVYESGKNYIVCANHYQGGLFMQDSVNLKNIDNSDSKYRFDRVNELLTANFPVNYQQAAGILRNKYGLKDKFIGYGNPKSLNQLIAHHSIIFKPKELKMWVSSSCYQLGTLVCYDVNQVFTMNGIYRLDSFNISPDSFLYTNDYTKYEDYKKIKEKINKYVMLGLPFAIDDGGVKAFINDNPESYVTYMVLGNYYKKKKEYKKATEYYTEALQHDVASNNEILSIEKNRSKCVLK